MTAPVQLVIEGTNGAVATGTTANPLVVSVGGSGSGTVNVLNVSSGEYETVAAGQTAQVLGATGATGDFLAGLLVVPGTTSPGNVLLLDNATSITVFTGGASSGGPWVGSYIERVVVR